jgi:acyl carrier protein
MSTFNQVRALVGEVLQLGDRTENLGPDSPLLGAIPELDSMAVVSVITALEESFDILVQDDDISADVFETLGTLAEFVDRRLQ